MKISAKRILSVLLAFTLVLTMFGAHIFNVADASATNLLNNASFENFSGGEFANWYVWKGNHGNTDIAQVAGKEGQAAKLSVNDNSSIANISQVITPGAEGEYTLSVWIKIENIVRQWETAPGVYLTLRNNNAIVAQSTAVNTNTDWTKLELTVDAAALPAGDKTFDLTIEYVKGDIYVDEAVFCEKEAAVVPPPAGETDPDELLKNNSFETFAGGGFENWYLWPGNHGNTDLAQVSGKTGNAAKISVNDNSSIVNMSQVITFDQTDEYTLSVWIKIENIVRQWETAPGVYLTLRNNNAIVAQSTAVNTNTDWIKLELTVDPASLPAGEKTIDLTIEFVKGDIYLDDASQKIAESSVTPPPVSDPDELLKNNGLETLSGSDFADWSLWKGNQGNTTIAQVDGRTGKAAKITVDNNNNIVNFYQSVNLDPTKKYTLTVWVKTENLALQWDGAQGVYLALSYNNNIELAKSALVKASADWQKLELTVNGNILTGSEESVQFDIFAEYMTGNIYIDDASLKVAGDIDDDDDDDDDEEDTAPLKNSGFEKFGSEGFKYWTFWPGNKGGAAISQADGRTDKAAKIDIDNNESIIRLYQEVTLDPTKEYTFSVWVKTENAGLQWATAPGVYVNLACDNAKVLASESVNENSGWTKLSVVINGAVLTGEEWSVCFDLAVEYMSGTVYVDDATLEVTGNATPIVKPDEDELLKNNSFEIYSAGNFANWTTWKGNKGNTKFEQVAGRTGKGVKITIDDNNNIVNLYQEVAIDPTKEYTFSVWVKTEGMKLQWAGAQGVYLNFKYNNNVILMSKPVAQDQGWTKLELKVNGGILKGDEWGVSLDIASEYFTGVVYVDDASVKATGKGTPVADEDPDELLSNSSLELFSGYNFAKWGLNKGNNGNTLLTQTTGRTGKGAKMVVDNNNNIVSLYQGVALDPTKQYTFSVWIKAEDIELQWAGAEGIYLALGYNNLTPVRSKTVKADSDWIKLEVSVGGGDIPADAWDIRFAVMAEFLTGTIYIDDASVKVSGDYVPKPDSYLQNGGFDTPGEDTAIEGWDAYAEDIFSVLERNGQKTALNSSASASIFNGDKNAVSYWEQKVESLETDKDYLIKGYIFSEGITSDEGGAAVFVEFYDKDGHLIRTYRTDYVKGDQADWTEFAMKLTFPENCYTMNVRAALTKAVGTAYFDEFVLVEYDETVHTAELGTIENLYTVSQDEDEDTENEGTSSDNTNTDTDKAGIPVYVWFVIGGAVLLIAGAVVLVILKKKKAIK